MYFVCLLMRFLHRVWTKVDTYVGSETLPDEWELMQLVSVQAYGFASIADLPDFDVPLTFSVNTRDAFWIVSDQRVLYGREAPRKQVEEAGDGVLFILVGDITFELGSFLLSTSSKPHAWNGQLRYCETSAINVSPSTSPTGTFAPSHNPSTLPSSILNRAPSETLSLTPPCTPIFLDSIQYGFTAGYGKFHEN